jgi:hypothetical protein
MTGKLSLFESRSFQLLRAAAPEMRMMTRSMVSVAMREAEGFVAQTGQSAQAAITACHCYCLPLRES